MEQVNLKDLFNYLLRKWYITVFSLIVLLIGGTIYSTCIKKPLYESNANVVLVSEANTNYNQSDLSFNQKLVTTYAEIITSRKVLDQVIEDLELNYTYDELFDMVDVSVSNNTEVIRIYVKSKDMNEACDIANDIVTCFSNEVNNIYNLRNVSLLDEAIVNNEPTNMNLPFEIVLYVGFGLLFGLSIEVLLFFFDTSIKSKEEIESKYGINVIGNVPFVKEK